MFINIEEKIEFWKKNLLDLGRRNKLINFRPTNRSTLGIRKPTMFELWDSLVEDEKPLKFSFYPDVDKDTLLSELNEKEKNPVITDKETYGDLQKTLANLRAKSRSVIEEQGINTLYLAFAFLQWTDIKQSNQKLLSPLLLVPVKINHASILSPYELSLADDEIVVNPALKHKFSKDFGIDLPDFDEDIEFATFIDNVKELANEKNWTIEEATYLGLFSFLKINMYNDLENNREEIAKHPIVRAICGDKDSVTPLNENINEICNNLDKNITPEDTYQVLDADSSQQKAIICANKGMSFILQGPPGTGKSQTITNIIAESLAHNKKVLFVSEKIAALDVVHKRLKASNLDDFCLVLHNHKANKKDVLEELNKSLELAGKKSRVLGQAKLQLQRLYKDKEELNTYACELHKVIEPLGKTIYEVNGEIALVENSKDVIFDIEDIRNTTIKTLNNYITLLQEFCNTYSEQALNPELNPWKNTVIKNVSNELRRNINANLPPLVNALRKVICDINDFKSLTTLKNDLSFNDIASYSSLLSLLIKRPVVYYSWFSTYDLDNLLTKVDSNERVTNKIKTTLDKVKEDFASLNEREKEVFYYLNKDFYNNKEVLPSQIKLIEEGILNDPYLKAIKESIGAEAVKNQANIYKEKAIEIKTLKGQIENLYEEEIFDLDVSPILKRIKTEYTSFLRVFKKSYKEDVRSLKSYAKDITLKINNDLFVKSVCDLYTIQKDIKEIEKKCGDLNKIFGERLDLENTDITFISGKIDTYQTLTSISWSLSDLQKPLNKLREEDDNLQSFFDSLYNGLDTSWDTIRENIKWCKNLKEYLSKNYIDDEFIEVVCDLNDIKSPCTKLLKSFEDFVSSSSSLLDFYYSLFKKTETNEFKKDSLNKLLSRVSECASDLCSLEQWIDFNRVCKTCSKAGLETFINNVISMKLQKDEIIPSFKKRFYSLWLDSVINEYPSVRDFRRHIQDNKVNDFKTLDRKQLEIAKARIRNILINSLPVVDSMSSSLDEVGILKRELNKQRRRMPIRKLFRKIPNLIMSFKPCLMMSPLSVSLFLESNAYKFDIVIFDEASQVKTENAIGAIFRGKQLVIAGDSKQLPPTNFFNVTNSDNDFDNDEEENDYGNYESVIDEANLLAEETLKWHYRSRDEQLIAFSNSQIYNNQLITFPSNKNQTVKDNGLEYYYLPNGVYDRGGSKGNVVEADKVADLVFAHFKNHPNQSLGVITFGEKQQAVIEQAVLERRIKNPEFEKFFSEENGEEPFFIKNLESVQGDERDTIILSIGYAKDKNGVFRLNFGPLNKNGGERRLNVAVTRAKYNLKLVGSILPQDIDLDKITSEGPKLLRAYIDFAKNGISVLNTEKKETIDTEEEPFEQAIYNFLCEKGYMVEKRVGCSSYRIDLAVKHPTIRGVYVLGIECDGETYHQSKTARERDRLRQDVLENMGWNIYRIWSSDWIKDSKAEGERLLNIIKDSINNYSKGNFNKKVEREEDKEKEQIEIEEDKIVNENNIYDFDSPDLTKEDLLPKSCYINGGSFYFNVIQTIEKKGDKVISKYIDVIKKCSPLHIDELCNIVINNSSLERNSVPFRNGLLDVLKPYLDENKIIVENNFLLHITANPYQTHYGNVRKVEHIAIEELANAMYTVLQKKVGLTKENLIVETAKAYNFSRMSKAKEECFNNAFDMLIERNKAEIVNNKVKIK